MNNLSYSVHYPVIDIPETEICRQPVEEGCYLFLNSEVDSCDLIPLTVIVKRSCMANSNGEYPMLYIVGYKGGETVTIDPLWGHWIKLKLPPSFS